MIRDSSTKDKILYGLLTAIYFALIMWGIIHHEPWRDEARVWLISEEGIKVILEEAKYEGTPVLWHLLVYILIALNLSYKSMFILHGLIAVIAVSIFLFYSPFSNFTKIAFIFSYYMAYEYAVIARNYNITILLLFLIGAIYKDRFKRPLLYGALIFLLFNTNTHSLFIAGYLFLLYSFEVLIENREKSLKKFLPVIIMALGGIAAFVQIMPSGDVGTKMGQHFMPGAFLTSTATAITVWWMPINNGAIAVSLIILAAITLSCFLKKPKILLLMIFSCGWLAFIFTFVKEGALRHHGLILIFLIFALWLSNYYEETDFKEINNKIFQKCYNIISSSCNSLKLTGDKAQKTAILLLNISLLLSSFTNISYYYFEYEHSFSGSKEAAWFIINNNYEDYVIAGYSSSVADSLGPYLSNNKFWSPDLECYCNYVRLSDNYYKEREKLNNLKVIERINKNFPDKTKVLLLLSAGPLDYPEQYGYRLIFENEKTVFRTDEVYWLYETVK